MPALRKHHQPHNEKMLYSSDSADPFCKLVSVSEVAPIPERCPELNETNLWKWH